MARTAWQQEREAAGRSLDVHSEEADRERQMLALSSHSQFYLVLDSSHGMVLLTIGVDLPSST